jgi:Tol biopolymer transport system component
MSTEVFVSYSSQDYERVMPLVERLRGGGVAVWVDEGGIDAATLWSESIVEAIAECHVLIMMVSSHSTDSHNVLKEVMIASESKKTILPIYLEPAEIPARLKYQLTGIQHLEWFDGGNDRVYETLKDGLAKRGVTIDGKTPTTQALGQAAQKQRRRPHRPPTNKATTSITKNIALATLAIACAILGFLLLQSPEPITSTTKKNPIHLLINIPEGEKFYFDLGSQYKRSIAVSSDGNYFAYISGQKADGNHTLWLHSTKDNQRIKLKSSALLEGLSNPFFSPDEKWLAFYVGGKMHRVSTSTNEENIICDASLVDGGSWGENNNIYFSPHGGSQLQIIDVNKSNDPEIVESNSQGSNVKPYIKWPEYLPDGRGLLFFDHNKKNINANYGNIYHFDLVTKINTVLVQNGFSPKYSNTGHLLYIRDNTLKARTFDISTLTVGKEEITLVSGIRMNPFWGNAQYSISDEGTLAYIPGTNTAKGVFAWAHRSGVVERIENMDPNVYCRYALNSTGEKLAAPVSRERSDIYVFDLTTGESTPITIKGMNLHPVWSPDDSKIIFTKITSDVNQVMQISSNGAGAPEMLYESSNRWVMTEHWSKDGTKVSISDYPDRTGYLDLNETPPKFVELASSDGATIFGFTFSPNGKWISYGSSISGGYSCYIAPIDDPTQAQLITKVYKGEEPRWAPDGKEIFYRSAQGLFSVPLEFDSNDGVKIGTPELIINIPWIDNHGIGYDVHPSGEKFLVVVHEKEEVSDHFNIVLNFDALIEEKFAELKNNK